MSEPKFTPGPWYPETDAFTAWVFAERRGETDDYGIADCDPCVGEDVTETEREANARLIAAAPDIYTALANLVEACRIGGCDGSDPDTCDGCVAVNAGKAALKKAADQ